MKIFAVVLSFLLFTFIIALPPLALQYTGYRYFLAPGFWASFFFLSGVTLLALVVMLIVKQKEQDLFAQAFLGGTTFKILACLVFIFVLLAKYAGDKHVFVTDFFYIYLLNTAFEVYVLLRKLRHEN
jgi:hypothetical protein